MSERVFPKTLTYPNICHTLKSLTPHLTWQAWIFTHWDIACIHRFWIVSKLRKMQSPNTHICTGLVCKSKDGCIKCYRKGKRDQTNIYMSQGNQHMTFSVFIRHEMEKEGVKAYPHRVSIFNLFTHNVKIAFGGIRSGTRDSETSNYCFLISLMRHIKSLW